MPLLLWGDLPLQRYLSDSCEIRTCHFGVQGEESNQEFSHLPAWTRDLLNTERICEERVVMKLANVELSINVLADPGDPGPRAPPLPPRFFQNYAVFRQF